MIKELLLVGVLTFNPISFSELNNTGSEEILSINELIGNTFTFTEDNSSFTFNFLNETDCEIVGSKNDTTISTNGTYSYENDILSIYINDILLGTFTVDFENYILISTSNTPDVPESKEIYSFDFVEVEGGSVDYQVVRTINEKEEIITENFQKGDKVNLVLTPNIFYTVSSLNVTVGDTIISLEHQENTTEWSFYLNSEGTYTITPSFVVNNELFQQFLDLYNDFKTGDLSQIFSIQNISFVVLTLIYIVYFITKIVSDHKFRKNVIGEVCSSFGLSKDMTPTQISENIIRNVVIPVVDRIDKNENDIKDTIEKLLICFLYMQENTPTAKQEIVKIIGAIQNKSDEVDKVADLVLKKLQDKQKLEEIKKQQVNKDIDTIKQQVNKDIQNSTNQGAFDNNSLPVD